MGCRIVDFVARLTGHAAKGIMEQVMAWNDPLDIQAGKVGAWLMNEEATVWDEVDSIQVAVGGDDW